MAATTLQELQVQIDELVQKTGKTGINAFNISNLDDAQKVLSALTIEYREMMGDLDYINRAYKDSVNSLSRQNTYLLDARKALNNISSISSKILEHRKGENVQSTDQIKKLEARATLEYKALELAKDSGTLNTIQQREVEDSLKYRDAFNNELERTLNIEKQINKEIGLAGVAVKGLADFAKQLGFGDLAKPLSDAIDKTKEARRQLALNKEALKELAELQGTVGTLTPEETARQANLEAQNIELDKQTSKYKNIAKSLKEQVTLVNATDFLLGKVVQAFFAVNKASVDFQRLTGQNESIQASLNLRFATSVDYLQTATELTEKLGYNANNVFTSSTLATAAEFKNLLGLSGDEAGNLAILAEATGTDLETNTEHLVDQVSAFNKSNRSAISQGKVLKDVANTSQAITVSLGSNPAKLAEAASQAARLGMSLKDVDTIASSLLDFESSIEAELEAQLLTGKEINLAKAREYALTNQLDKLGQEIFEKTTDIAEYGNMNRIAQEAYAKSLGMTRDQLSRTAYLRALEAGMTEDQAKAAANVSLEDMKRVTAQESLNKSIEKMAQALAGPVDLLASMVGHTWVMYGVMGAIAGIISVQIVTGLVSMGSSLLRMIPQLATMLALKQGIAIADISAATAATVGLGAIAIAGGIALAVGAMMSAMTSVDDGVISPDGGLVVSGPEGSIKLNPNDSIVAGTDLFANSNKTSLQAPAQLSTIDFSPLVAEFQAMKQILTSIRDKEGNVYLDTDLVGKALVVGSTAI